MQSIYGPPEDGAVAITHAAVVPPRKVRPWKASLGGPDAQGRFFAKGFFASKLVSCARSRTTVWPLEGALRSQTGRSRTTPRHRDHLTELGSLAG